MSFFLILLIYFQSSHAFSFSNQSGSQINCSFDLIAHALDHLQWFLMWYFMRKQNLQMSCIVCQWQSSSLFIVQLVRDSVLEVKIYISLYLKQYLKKKSIKINSHFLLGIWALLLMKSWKHPCQNDILIPCQISTQRTYSIYTCHFIHFLWSDSYLIC